MDYFYYNGFGMGWRIWVWRLVLAWGIGIEWTTPGKIRGRTWDLGRLLDEMEKKYVKDGGMDGGLLFDLGLLVMPVDAGGKSQLLRVLSHMDGYHCESYHVP